MSSWTSHSASRHSASSSRSAMKPSISLRTTSGRMPTARYTAAARSMVSGAVALAAAQLDQRQQVDGVERVADDEPLGVPHLRLQQRRQQARGRRAERSRRARPPRLAAASSRCLSSTRSGADSWTKSAPSTASSTEDDVGQRALGRQRRQRQAPVGAARIAAASRRSRSAPPDRDRRSARRRR